VKWTSPSPRVVGEEEPRFAGYCTLRSTLIGAAFLTPIEADSKKGCHGARTCDQASTLSSFGTETPQCSLWVRAASMEVCKNIKYVSIYEILRSNQRRPTFIAPQPIPDLHLRSASCESRSQSMHSSWMQLVNSGRTYHVRYQPEFTVSSSGRSWTRPASARV
jgi:hypothetical protein